MCRCWLKIICTYNVLTNFTSRFFTRSTRPFIFQNWGNFRSYKNIFQTFCSSETEYVCPEYIYLCIYIYVCIYIYIYWCELRKNHYSNYKTFLTIDIKLNMKCKRAILSHYEISWKLHGHSYQKVLSSFLPLPINILWWS